MTALITLRGLERTYPGPPPFTALREIDLTVGHGDYVAIVGPSGSGKSTLLNLLGLLDRPTSGRYELEGTDVSLMSDAERSAVRGQRIGFVFQSFHLLPHRSAMENVMLAQLYLPQRDRARAEAARSALRQVGLGHRIDAMPTMLSGGERQRVAIARALVNRPGLLLCDEPTGNLDSASSANIMAMLGELHSDGQTIIVITHDPAVAERAQRIVVISDGRLTEELR